MNCDEGLKIKAINERNIKQGERVVLAIRPETCEMKKGHIEARIVCLGKSRKPLLRAQLFVMRLGLITVTALLSIVHRLTEEWVNIGEEVTITYPLDKAHLFPYPEAGLIEEIKV